MRDDVLVPLLTAGLFFGMLACHELGYRLSPRRSVGEDESTGRGTLEAAIFALLGLLLGFAFLEAMERLEARRGLIVQEANAISTAYLRLDLLPAADQPELRRLFREYLETRFDVYKAASDEVSNRQLAKATDLQQQIWKRTVASSVAAPIPDVAATALPAINEMMDVTTARNVARQTRVPTLILVLLFGVALASAFLVGYAKAQRNLLHAAMYAAAVAVTVYVVLDLDHPRIGLIRLDATERILQDLHDSIK